MSPCSTPVTTATVATGVGTRTPIASKTRTFPVVSSVKKRRPSGANAIFAGIVGSPEASVSTWKPGSSVAKVAGRGGVTWIASGPSIDPAAFEAVTVYVARNAGAVGVPKSTPVTGSRTSPGGSAGVTANAVAAAPPTIGASGVAGTFCRRRAVGDA